jgi:hypothetical protein
VILSWFSDGIIGTLAKAVGFALPIVSCGEHSSHSPMKGPLRLDMPADRVLTARKCAFLQTEQTDDFQVRILLTAGTRSGTRMKLIPFYLDMTFKHFLSEIALRMHEIRGPMLLATRCSVVLSTKTRQRIDVSEHLRLPEMDSSPI